jgi:hypothetical protein
LKERNVDREQMETTLALYGYRPIWWGKAHGIHRGGGVAHVASINIVVTVACQFPAYASWEQIPDDVLALLTDWICRG